MPWRAAGRKAGHEHPSAVDAEFHNGALDHLTDRQRFAALAPGVARKEPGEAILRIVGRLLLGIDASESEPVGERGPARVRHHQNPARKRQSKLSLTIKLAVLLSARGPGRCLRTSATVRCVADLPLGAFHLEPHRVTRACYP